MKAIIEFNLDDPDECQRHKAFITSEDRDILVFELDQELRKIVKYEALTLFGDTFENTEDLVDLIRVYLNDNCIEDYTQ